MVKHKSGLVTAGLVLGIIGIVFSLIPIINNISFVLGALALIFGIVGLVKKASRGKAIAAVVLGAVTIALVLVSQLAFSHAIDQAVKDTSHDTKQSQKADTSTAWDVSAAYDKIQTGMTKDQVEQATGKTSDSCTASDSNLGSFETCSYGNGLTDKGVITVTYSDGAVSNKVKSTY